MSTLELFNRLGFNEFDILFGDLFNTNGKFTPIHSKLPHPLNILQTESELRFEIACTGLSKEEVEVSIEEDVLRISYKKKEKEDFQTEPHYWYKGLSQRSFNLGYKISSKFDLSKSDAKLENGLLTVSIPLVEKASKTLLEIK